MKLTKLAGKDENILTCTNRELSLLMHMLNIDNPKMETFDKRRHQTLLDMLLIVDYANHESKNVDVSVERLLV